VTFKLRSLASFDEQANPEDFEGWVVGFHGEWSDKLAKLLVLVPGKLADAQVARWQSKYGREPTVQQRAWLANKIRTDIAREVPPAHWHGCAEKDGTGVPGLGPPARQGTTGGPFDGTIGWRSWYLEPWDGQDPPADSDSTSS
jgi:hypothetical protein